MRQKNQFALAYDCYPNPTDTRTFIPFLEKIESKKIGLPENIVADAGYASEENYCYVLDETESTPHHSASRLLKREETRP